MSNLQSADTIKSRELETVLEHVFISYTNFRTDKEWDFKGQELDIIFRISLGKKGKKENKEKKSNRKCIFLTVSGETTKKPAKKKVKTEEKEKEKEKEEYPKVGFTYHSKWEQDRHAEQLYIARLRVIEFNDEEVSDEENLHNDNEEEKADKDKYNVLSLYGGKEWGEGLSLTLRINWDLIDKILETLRMRNVDPAHFLEILRCCIFHSKATRVAPDKWNLPTSRPTSCGIQKIDEDTPTKQKKKEKVAPTTKKSAREYVDDQITTLCDQLRQLCDKIETCTLPVYVNSVYIRASPLKETSMRKHEIIMEVVLEVQKEENGDVKTSAEHKLVVPLLEEFNEEGTVYDIYRSYKNILEYMPNLLYQKVPNITEEECKRLMTIYRPWFNNLANWSNLKSKKNNEPWIPTRIVSHLLKSNFNISIELKTEAPPTSAGRVTRSKVEEKHFTHLWTVGQEKGKLEDIIRKETQRVADGIVDSFKS